MLLKIGSITTQLQNNIKPLNVLKKLKKIKTFKSEGSNSIPKQEGDDGDWDLSDFIGIRKILQNELKTIHFVFFAIFRTVLEIV